MWSQVSAKLSLGLISRDINSSVSRPSEFKGFRSLDISREYQSIRRPHTSELGGALQRGTQTGSKMAPSCKQKRSLKPREGRPARPSHQRGMPEQLSTSTLMAGQHQLQPSCLDSHAHADDSVNYDAYRALVLDVSYKPVDVMSWQRAIVLGLYEKAEVLSYYSVKVRSATQSFPLPAVIKTHIYLRFGEGPDSIRMSLSRGNVLRRDGYTCQYCGVQKDLTIDHLIPQSKGGDWSWDNLVTACARCNVKKADKSPQEAGLVLHKRPQEPPFHGLITATSRTPSPSALPQEWQAYLPGVKSALELGIQ